MRTARLLAVALVLAACGNDTSDSTRPDDPARFANESLDEAAGRPATDAGEAETTTTTLDPDGLDPTDIPGEPVNQFDLGVGDCFDRLEDLQQGRPVVITTRLPCDDIHSFEVFHRLNYPAPHPSIFPGEAVMRQFAVESCYREFEGWVGAEYELSALEIGVFTPPRENFEDDRARYRGIHCWVERFDGDPMTGSSRDSGW